MNTRNTIVAAVVAVGLGMTGTAAAAGGFLSAPEGEGAPPPVTTLTAQIAPDLVYFHDSDGAVYAAEGHASAASQAIERCGFQPNLQVLEGARSLSVEVDLFIQATACEASALKVTVGDDGIPQVFFLGRADESIVALADQLGLGLEVEIDHAD